MIGAVIAAAGLSSRMGAFKPLLPYRGKTILATTIDKLHAVGVKEIIIVVGHRHTDIEKYFTDDSMLKFVYNPYYRDKDMLFSLQYGIKSVKKSEAIFLMPADMPAIAIKTFSGIVDAWNSKKASVIIPCQNGRHKHPPLIGKQYFSSILSFQGEGGLHSILEKLQERTFFMETIDDGLNFDVDTPDEYKKLLEFLIGRHNESDL
ncbi:MAG: nucleotidyltransferase family protein [Selenomonadaceae bacterium]